MVNYAKIRYTDVANGPGIRQTIFFSGCNFNCKGCFNKEAQDFDFGSEFTKEVQDEFIEKAKRKHITGINILGGEPLQQDWAVLKPFLKRLKEETGKPIWIWTGFEDWVLFTTNSFLDILVSLEVVITGQFELDKKDLNLMYRGSSNQKVIDVKATLETKDIVLWEVNN